MNYAIRCGILAGLVVSATALGARGVGNSVGTHALHVAEPGQQSRVVSVPFLKVPTVRGRLDGVNAGLHQVSDAQAGFTQLEAHESYILRITTGRNAGDWFLLDTSSASDTTVTVSNDGVAGELSSLDGDEAFAIHALYRLKELLPENGTVVPSAGVDQHATQVHLFNGRGFDKIWLSNGAITEHEGWTLAQGNTLQYAGDLPIMPGSSFLVFHPQADETVKVHVQGVVLETPLNVPLSPGVNFVSVGYSQANQGAIESAYRLEQLGLAESGFQTDGNQTGQDMVLFFNPDNVADVSGRYYLDGDSGEFLQASESRVGAVAEPGSGFIIMNGGEAFIWSAVK